MIAGLALALGSALGTNSGFLFKQRGAVLAPPVRARHPLSSAAGLFRSRAFTLGWAVAVGAWGLHVGALALAPLSIVQAVLSGGLVFLAVLAERYFGFQLGRRQSAGVIATTIGLAVIAITGMGAHQRVASLLARCADRRGVRRVCARCRADPDLNASQHRAGHRGADARHCRRRALRGV